MSSNVDAPPPVLQLVGSHPVGEVGEEYRWVRFDGDHHPSGEIRSELIVGLRNMRETDLIIEVQRNGDIYALFRIEATPEADRQLHGWIDRLAQQRIYDVVRQGWVRMGDEVVSFVK